MAELCDIAQGCRRGHFLKDKDIVSRKVTSEEKTNMQKNAVRGTAARMSRCENERTPDETEQPLHYVLSSDDEVCI